MELQDFLMINFQKYLFIWPFKVNWKNDKFALSEDLHFLGLA